MRPTFNAELEAVRKRISSADKRYTQQLAQSIPYPDRARFMLEHGAFYRAIERGSLEEVCRMAGDFMEDAVALSLTCRMRAKVEDQVIEMLFSKPDDA